MLRQPLSLASGDAGTVLTMTEPRIIDLTREPAVVAMATGDGRLAIGQTLERVGMHVAVTEDRGRPLPAQVRDAPPRLLVGELSRLGEAGLVGLASLARARPRTAIVLLLPGGIGGPAADVLGLSAVVVRSLPSGPPRPTATAGARSP